MNEYSHLTDAQWDLYSRMREISEEDFCAGWMMDNEFRIWDALHQRATEQTTYPVNPRLLRLCAALSAQIGGWIYWADGPQFIPMAQWLEMVESYRKLASSD